MVTSFDVTANRKVDWNILPLDPDLYWIKDNEKDFFKSQTGITSDEELKEHILEIQKLAYSVVPYPCIRLFSFLRMNITRHDTYQQVLALGENRPGAIFLDVGAGFGVDVRKLTTDGYPVENVIGTDLHEGLWNAGHDLFKSTPITYPVTFIPGDIFGLTEGINQARVSDSPEFTPLRSLLPLKGRISVIYMSHFWHLFDEKRGTELAGRIGQLLSPETGSVVFGINLGAPTALLQTTPAGTMFCHSPESWKKMWDKVFPSGDVKVEAKVVKGHQASAQAFAGDQGVSDIWLLMWSVKRL